MASQADMLLLSQAVKDIPYGTTPNAPAGWSVSSIKYDDLTGMMAAAFKSNSSSEIVIGYQATNFSSGSAAWRDAQLAADRQIAVGVNPLAYNAALDFAEGVRTANPGAQISVTGFSLGGSEAQFVASITGFGGASYGGPGIAGYTYNLINADFESYINYGDLIATWGGLHVGVIKYVGSPLFLAPEALLSPAGSALVLDYTHDLNTYANNIIGSGTPQIPANVYFPAEFGVGTLFGATSGYPKFGGDLNTQFSVLSDGTLVSTFYAPDGTLVGNRTTGTDGSRSVSLFATSGQSWISETGFLNSKGQLDSINARQADGGVASTAFDLNNTQTWSSETLVRDINGALKTQADVLDSLNQYTKYYDIKNTRPYNELDVSTDSTGKVTAAQAQLDQNIIAAGGSVGQIFGSALGRALAPNNQFAQLAIGTVAGLIGQKLLQTFTASLTVDASRFVVSDFASARRDGLRRRCHHQCVSACGTQRGARSLQAGHPRLRRQSGFAVHHRRAGQHQPQLHQCRRRRACRGAGRAAEYRGGRRRPVDEARAPGLHKPAATPHCGELRCIAHDGRRHLLGYIISVAYIL
jgi:hypothetical protein